MPCKVEKNVLLMFKMERMPHAYTWHNPKKLSFCVYLRYI